ncbi:TonB-dependent siderophore receptor [uncultured Cocleimonas sp.]|uniref:TonB-dependent receptor plug domain-containing protein n=1 Tax=uncultured Cocleimonas sp. TaxID=1051587 RepID=UPI0026345F5D|nr:TonB-dependent receptor [uncultured Cocleimonas sp.]
MKKIVLLSLLSAVTGSAFAENDVLDEVIVTATRSEIDTTEAPGSVTVISRKEIEEKGGENVLDLIRGTTGVSLQGIGSGGRKTISLRGMESKHTLILVDGKRIPGTNDTIGPNTDYQYDWVPTSQIERIEVVRGPMSVLYGSDALGGVINIITRRPGNELTGNVKLTSRLANGDSINGSKDDGDGHDASFNISGGVSDNFQLSVGAENSRRASVDSQLNLGQSAIEGRKKEQLSLGADWQPAEDHNIELKYSTGQEKRWYDTATSRNVLYQSQYDIDRDQLSLGWKGTVGKITSSLRAYQGKVDISNKATNGVAGTAPQKLTDTVVEGNISTPLGEKHFITAGLEHRIEELENSNLVSNKENFSLNSLYIQDEIDITDSTLLTLGTRFDDHEVFGNEVSPRVSVVWSASDNLKLKGSYGHGFKAPNIKQASSDYVFAFGPYSISGNSDLEPETSDSFEVGANYTREKFSIDAAIFDSKVKNLIELTGPLTDRTYQNINEARLKGVEISSKILLTEALTLNTGYQYLDAKDGDGIRLNQRPQHTLSTGITWDKNKWQWNLNAEYLSGQIVEKNNVSTDVPSYTILNAGARRSINKNLDLAIRLDNLTNVRLEDKSDAFLHEEYPRTLSLELRGKF